MLWDGILERAAGPGNEIASCRERASSGRNSRGWGIVKGARRDSGKGVVGCGDIRARGYLRSVLRCRKKAKIPVIKK
jgi:hypothetical protein